jgi:hypothetical protein
MRLLGDNKEIKDALTSDLFRWHESIALSTYELAEYFLNFTSPASVSKSVLCHVFTIRWGKNAGYRIGSKERCRRLTAEVVNILNNISIMIL